MPLRSFETIANQAESTAKNIVSGAAASVRAKTSITRWANRLIAGTRIKEASIRVNREEGVYILSAEDVRKGCRLNNEYFMTPDGYVRRSPVQEIVVAPGYRRRLVMRGILYAIIGVIAVVAIYALMRLGILAF